MKKILSIVLCVTFMNCMYCPIVMADDFVQNAGGEQIITDGDYGPESSSQSQVQAQSQATAAEPAQTWTEQPVQTPQSAEVSEQTQQVSSVEQTNTEKTEHLSIRKNKSKKISVESVYLTSHDVEIPAQDILQVAFVSDFNGRRARVGDTIEFRFPNDIVTQEGTMIIPSTARIIAEITQLKKPKPLHLSGKVYLNFKYIEVNGTRKPIEARLYGKKDFLSRKTLNNTAAVGETALVSGAGAAAGAAICAATATDAAVLVFGTAVTGGFGAIAGAALGILLPGASFKAKAGQTVTIQLTQELDI